MYQILNYLRGKKALILALITVIVPVLTTYQIVDQTLGNAITAIAGILLGGAKAMEFNKNLGNRILAGK